MRNSRTFMLEETADGCAGEGVVPFPAEEAVFRFLSTLGRNHLASLNFHVLKFS